ncbi:MAG: hypothetical protein ACR2M0_10705 [Chloroflexia bacterium]
MARIPGIDESNSEQPDFTSSVFDLQRRTYGRVLESTLLYARRPSILRAARGMWSGLAASRTLEETLVYLVNVRVAGLVGCPF